MAHSKRYRKAREGADRNTPIPVAAAVKLVKANATAKFDETIEIAFNLGIDTRQSDQTVRGALSLPHGAGADVVGAADLAEKVEKGEINFDRVIATPDMMAVVGKLGKVLGPRGLMPNPKLGTVTMDVTNAVKAAKGGQVQFRAEKAGIVHAGIGKASFSEKAIEENVRAFYGAIAAAKPAGAKGAFIKRVSLSSTMGPGVQLDIADLSGSGA